MAEKKFHFHDGKGGSSLAVRVTPRATTNQLVEALNDGTIRIRLTTGGTDARTNQELLSFLGGLLNIPVSQMELVAGENSRDKLVAIFDLDADMVHQRLIRHLS
jgi:uncharacterized protein YggU (UPF0235/DUF167 family)